MTAKTVKVPHVKTYEAQWDKRPQPAQTNWYKGSQPTQRETLARIYEIGKQDETKRVDLMRMYEEELKNPSSPIYNPYTSATTTNATKTNAANTLKAQDEWARLSDELSYWATRTDRNYSDDEIISRIDWDNYKTLQKMDEGRMTGSPLELTEAVGYSQDAMYGVLWAARNPGASTGNAMYDAAQRELGRGNQHKASGVSAYRDATSDYYSPYKAGATALDDLAYKYGMTGDFDEAWLNGAGRSLLNGDEESRKDYARIYDTVMATNEYRADIAALNKSITDKIEAGMSPDEIFNDSMFDAFPKAKELYESQRRGVLKDTSGAVDFSLMEMYEAAEKAYTDRMGRVTPEEYNAEVVNTLGSTDVTSNSAKVVKPQTAEQLRASRSIFAPYATEMEKRVLQSIDPSYGEVKANVKNGVLNGSAGSSEAYKAAMTDADDFAAQNYLTNLDALRTLQSEKEALQQYQSFYDKWLPKLDADPVNTMSDPEYVAESEAIQDAMAVWDKYAGDAAAIDAAIAEQQKLQQKILSKYADAELLNESGYAGSTMLPMLNFIDQFNGFEAGGYSTPAYEWETQLDSGADWGKVKAGMSQQMTTNAQYLIQLDTAIRQAELYGVPENYIEGMQNAKDMLIAENTAIQYGLVRDNADFSAKVKEFDETQEPFKRGLRNLFERPTREEIIKTTIIDPVQAVKAFGDDGADVLAGQMSESEKETYKYLYMTEGEERATAYYESLAPQLNARGYESMMEQAQVDGLGEGAGKTLASIFINAGSVFPLMSNAIASLNGEKLDPYSPSNWLTAYSGEVRASSKKAISDAFKDNPILDKVANFAYDAATTAADSTTASLIGGSKAGSLFLMGTSAAQSTLMDASARNAEGWQAWALAGASAAAETLTEFLPTGNMFEAFELGGTAAIKELGENIIKGIASDAPGEMVSEFLSGVTDDLIMQEMSNSNLRIQQLMDEYKIGYDEASAIVQHEAMTNILYAGLLSVGTTVGTSTSAFAGGKVMDSLKAQRNPVMARAAGVLSKAGNGGSAEKAATISGVLEGMGADPDTADAVAQTAVSENADAADAVRGILLHTEDEAVLDAIEIGTMVPESQTGQVLAEIQQNGATDENAAALVEAAKQDREDPAVLDQLDGAVLEHAEGAASVNAMMGNTAAYEAVEKAESEAKKNLDAAQGEYDKAKAYEVKASADLGVANHQFNNNPADDKFKAAMLSAIETLNAAQEASVNAEQALNDAKAAYDEAHVEAERQRQKLVAAARSQAEQYVGQRAQEIQAARTEKKAAAELQRQNDNVLAMQADSFVNEYIPDAPADVKNQVRQRYMAYDGETQNATKGMVEFASQISKKFNLNITFTDSHGIFEGAYKGGNDIVLDKNATQGEVIHRVLVHELVHAAESSKMYDALADAVLHAYYNGNADQMNADLAGIAQQYSEQAGQDGQSVARSELVAQRLSDMLSGNQDALNRLVEEKPDVATRIWRAIKDFIGKLRGVRDPELDKLMKLEKQLEKALRSRHAGKETRFSIDVNSSSWYDYSRSFSEQVDDWSDGKIPENDTLLVGGTPEILQKIGLSRLPMTIDQTHVDYAINGTKNEDHHMGVEMLKNLPELLKDPVAIIESQTRPNDSLVVIVRGEVNGKQMMAAIEIGGVGVANAETIDVNKISSTQGRSNTVTKLLADALSNESPETPSIYFWNKTEAQNLFADAGVQFPGGAIQDGLIHSIFDAGSPVNKNFIEQIETRQFKRWFGKSKIVDSNGTPKVMYRGGDENIEIFDRKRSRANNLYGRGFYFTDSREHAGQYGNVQEYYLSVKNPLDAQSGAKRITQQQLRAFLEVVAEDEDYGLDNYGYGATVDSVLESLKGKSDFDVLQDINASAIGDFVAAIELFNDVNGTKYDGIVTPTETVVFDSKQIKSATDNIGTFDSQTPNVKFSLPSNDILDQRIAQHRNSQLAPALNDIIPSAGEPAQNYGTGERQFAGQTIQNSAVVPDWIKQEFLRPEELNYEVDTNREQVERSWQRIQENGYEAERDRLLSLDRYSADDTAEANLMMAMALREDTADPATFMALASHYNKEGTKAGQELQARKLFTRMSPTGARVWAAGQMESRLEDHMRTHQHQRRRIDENARRVADQIRDMQSGDEILRLNAGGDFTIDESNNRWGVPINEQQQALIDHYGLNNVARPGIFYNRATTQQRMLESILATPNPLEVTGLGLNLIQRLEYMQDGEAVITNADLNYIGTQLGQFVAQGGDEGGREADLAVSRAYEAYGNITPSTTREKLRTWRYVSMLLSVPSAIRNVIGNTSQNVVNATAHGIAVELDKAISRATGQRTVEHLNYQERINGWRGFVEETQNTFRDYFIDRSVTQRGNDKYNTNQRGRVYQTQFIENMRNMEGFLMSFGDRNMWRKAYLNSMAEQQKLADRNLLFNDDGTTRTHEQMLEQAEADANYATFTEDNAVSNVLSQLKNIPGVGEVIDFIMPFTGVPTNITRRMIQYSPIGLAATALRHGYRAATHQNFDQRAFVDGISRGLTGTALFGVGMLLAAAGVIKPGTGDEDDDKKYGLKTAMGGQYTPYVYNPLTDEYVSLAAFAPAASPLTMGLAAYEEFRNNEDWLQALISSCFSGADQIFDASYMSGVQDIFKGYGSPAENIVNTVFSNAVSQSVPALLTQLSNTIDPYVRDTKDKNAIVQALKSGLINRIPGLRQMLPEKVDVTGQTVRTKEGLRNFYDPFTTTDARKDPAVDELFRLSEALGSSSMLPSDALSGSKMTLTVNKQKVTVDGKGKETYRKRYGELWLEGGTTIDKKGRPVVVEGVRSLINSSAYQMMDDEERADAIADILSEAKTGAAMEALNKYGAD